jgi:hypothetical protein
MAAPRAISGNQGYLKVGGSAISEVTEFTGTIDYGVKTYVAQSKVVAGVGSQATVLGNQKCSGTISGLFDPNYSPGSVFNKGALIQFQLFLNFPTSFVSFQGRISTRTLGANFNTADPIPWSGTFESDGAITETLI